MSAATHRVRLNFPLERVKEPVLYHLVTDYGLKPNVYRANINVHEGGFLELELTGDPAAMERAKRWLLSLGISLSEFDGERDA
jgi:ABC-type methionine transport system ATPase subunit